jgi:hypothetical protein
LSRTLQNVQCSRSDNKHFTICSVSLFSCLLPNFGSRRIDCKAASCLYAS